MDKSKNTTPIEWTDEELFTLSKAMVISSRQNDSLDDAIRAIINLVIQNTEVRNGKTKGGDVQKPKNSSNKA